MFAPLSVAQHTGHPVEELYGAVEPVLAGRGGTPFKPQLTLLLERIQADPRAPRTAAAHKAAVVAVVRALARVAASEYDAAIADGTVVEIIEYQDSPGFILFVQQLLTSALRAGTTPEAVRILDPMQRKPAALARAWPNLTPPSPLVLPSGMVTILVNQLRWPRPCAPVPPPSPC